MNKTTSTNQGARITAEKWQRLYELLCNRLHSRMWLLQDALKIMADGKAGDNVELCAASLDGLSLFVGDMRRELEEANNILNF